MSQFARLREANAKRQECWPGSKDCDVLFRAVELGEEAGEVLGAVKKLTRALRGITGNQNNDVDARVQALKEEIGDVVITLDLLAEKFGIRVEDCVPMKFNMTSRKNSISVEMNPETWEVVV